MRNTNWLVMVFMLIFLGLMVFSTRFLLSLTKQNISADVLTGIVLLLSAALAYITYIRTRNNDQLVLSEKKRDDFNADENLAKVRMLIEHNDVELQTVIALLNTSEDPHDPTILPSEYWKLHEQFDQYLNFLEGVAILLMHKHISQESFESLWSYYFKRLREADTLDSNGETRLQVEGLSVNMANAVEIDDQIDGNPQVNPIGKPIWYYILHEEYAFRYLIAAVKESYERCQKKEVTARTPMSGTEWHVWLEWGARFVVWVGGLLFALLTVLGMIPILPEDTSIGLMFFLYVFLVAALIVWVFDMYRSYPSRRK